MENKKTFGEYVSKRRKEMGLTQKEFAEKLYVTESAISKWERGISYPDITLIHDICEALGISEHELLTASDDTQSRNSEKLAKKYIRLVNTYRNVLIFLYGISLLTCFICNIAVQHKLSWFFIVLASELIAVSLTLVPLIVPDKKALITLGSFTLSLSLLLLICNLYTGGDWFIIAFVSFIFGMSLVFLPFVLYMVYLPSILLDKKALLYFSAESLLLILLLFLCNLYTNGSWFVNIALPVAGVSLLLPWGFMLIIRYTHINAFFKCAGCFALTAAFHYTIQNFLHFILKDGNSTSVFQFDFSTWNDITINGNINMIVFFVLLLVAVTFFIAGIVNYINMSRPNRANQG
ncbi:helix-turn-helix domain-containing protein [Anaerocolumna xylanovorans]|uniref:Helix-turn-helix domain-containing protein n=1 Tax=Anaerocolumna xylanovorans DSM 12503 TaxID=1121345 RepID=A0A1M7Y0E9_9FIRM|nr:helix-turn-helix domain-containing protein [Anaerocolumna xylanovorans]SHO45090.1 Helix-turn-helix domain-containing protein [Anaerocolumna xylanovorans DSM 12503]